MSALVARYVAQGQIDHVRYRYEYCYLRLEWMGVAVGATLATSHDDVTFRCALRELVSQ